MGVALLANASMPLKYWDHAFLMATHLINHTPTKLLAYDTPLHRLLGATPDYSTLRAFGCACWLNLHKGHKCLDIASGCAYVSRDAIFDESIFSFTQLHPTAGAHYIYDVLLLPDSIPRASTNLPPDNVHTNACLLPTTLGSFELL
jgi:hypothetical protein